MSGIILVVDDNPDLVDGVKLTLEMEGFQVLAATSGQQALEVLGRITPDLILADIMMPNLDGYQLYIRVHNDSRWVHVPFIFLTAKTSKEDIRKGKEMGADDYITKPFDPQDLVAAVRGKLKRIAELRGQPAPGDTRGMLKALWSGKLGPVPVPLLVLLLVLIVVGGTLLATRTLRKPVPAFESPLAAPLRPDVGEMVLIPAGSFVIGADVAGAPTRQEVTLPAFEIDKYEVTMEQYKVFVEETDYPAPWGTYPEERAVYPVTNVTWEHAAAYCAWADKRLPSGVEWEKAARGTEALRYPWGDAWQAGRANTKEADVGGPQAVGSYPEGASPYGVMDLAGNVWEWVEDWRDSQQTQRVIRGGAWNAISKWAQTYIYNSVRPTEARNNIGFRCARP